MSVPATVRAESYTTFDTPRFILHIGRPAEKRTGEEIEIRTIASNSITVLNETFEELSRIFQAQPQKKVVLRFLSPKEFRKQTGAPSWTSAMYFRDEITIPLTKKTGMDSEELRRALRHEYVHAFIAELSDYRCPAWLDEGVAQLLEGQPNPLLGPALRDWIRSNPALPLDWLRNGFTTLDAEFVPAAYAQSLFATRKLVQELGLSAVTKYLALLHAKVPEEEAFRQAFGRTKAEFERELTPQIRRWARSNRKHP